MMLSHYATKNTSYNSIKPTVLTVPSEIKKYVFKNNQKLRNGNYSGVHYHFIIVVDVQTMLICPTFIASLQHAYLDKTSHLLII